MPSKLPSSTTDGLEWIEVSDFRPGIAQITSPNHPDGTATEENTYGCIAQSSGALVALPSKGTVPLTLPAAAPYSGASPDSDIYIVGAFCNDPVYSLEGGNQTLGGVDQNNSELYVALWYWERGTASQVNSLTVANATAGNFTLTVDTMTDGVPDGNPQTTGNIAYNASAATVETALEALSNVDVADITCAGGALGTNPVTLTWGGALANEAILVYANDDGLTGATAYAAVTTTTGADKKWREVYRTMLNRETVASESILSSPDDTTWFASVRPRVCEFGCGRSNSADYTTLGPAVVAFVFDDLARTFPDDAAPQALDTGVIIGEGVALVFPAHLCLHQGRAVVFPLTLTSMGPKQVYTTTEGFYWTEVNNFTILSPALTGYFNVVVAPEYPTGYGVMESLTADELLLIKARGGGLVLRGSLDDYSAKSLPNVKSTGQSLNRGTRSPVGFIYPVDAGGIWLWGGGDTSQNLSPNMDDEFWRPDYLDSDWGPGYTSCAQWQEWVLLPNNWIFDTDFGGFWRLDYPAEIENNSQTVVGSTAVHNWTVDWKGRHAYGFIEHMADNSTYEIIGYDYDRLDPRHTYSWQSQPMSATLDRAVKVRQCILTVSGSAGTVTVKIRSNKTGSEATLTYTHGVESGVDDDFPTAYAQACQVIGSHIQVQITSTATTNTDPAPIVHGFRLGIDEHAQLPR